MRVLILGATGSIGGAVTDELLAHGHAVSALARSEASERELNGKSVETIRGDIRDPEPWCRIVHDVDAIIHVAATFTDDMGDVDRALLEALTGQARKAKGRIRFLYTGGCWLYGATGNTVATEETPLDPIPSFAWMEANARIAAGAPNLNATIVHPAMVYERDGGVLSRFLASAERDGAIEVWGSLNTRWPVVHREDLATAYRILMEADASADAYNVAAEQGVRVADIVAAIQQRLGLTADPHVRTVQDAIAEHGDWAAGPALDQQMSAERLIGTTAWRPKHTSILTAIR